MIIVISNEVIGIICTSSRITMIGRRPVKRNRVSAAAANRPSRIETATVMKTTITLLRRLSRKLVWVMATMKLCRVGWLGKNVGVDVITSERGLKAVLIIQYTGKTHTRLNRMPRVFARQCRRLRRALVGWEMLTGPPPIAADYG